MIYLYVLSTLSIISQLLIVNTTITKKPVRCLYFITRDSQNQNCVIIANIKIVPQAHAYIIERFGGYSQTWGVGLHVKIPFIEKISKILFFVTHFSENMLYY